MDADVIIVGSGPAGVSAAWPLVEAGVRVLMLDASDPAPLPMAPRRDGSTNWRRDDGRLEMELGSRGAVVGSDCSPKFATPLSQATLAGFAEAAGLSASDYFAVGSLVAGGLSRIWGALATPYGADDLKAWGAEQDAMTTSYARVAGRIGLSGAAALSPAVEALFRAQRRRGSAGAGFLLSDASNAVLDRAGDGREACNACGQCLFGCGRNSIYHSALELPALRRHAHFTYRPGVRVLRLGGGPGDHHVEGVADGARILLRARTIVLAAGTLMTSSLALRRLGQTGRPIRIESNPVGGTAFLVPGLIGKPLPDRAFGLGQLFYTLKLDPHVEAAGVIYGADTVPLASVADRLPVSRPTALRVARALAPAMVLATGYLPGHLSANHLRVEDDGEGGRIAISGGHRPEAEPMLRHSFRLLARQMRRLGAWQLPGATQLLEPGADAHPAVTLPMNGHGPAATGSDGALAGLAGVYIADGAGLPLLSARHPTLTIMANADRIGRSLARSIMSVPDVSTSAAACST